MTHAERLSPGFDPGPLLRRLLRLAIIFTILGGLSYGGWWYFVKASDKAATTANLTETAVTKGRLVGTLATTGTAKSTLTSSLTFLASGQVVSVTAKVGDTVTAGTQLARLDDRDAQRTIATAKANLDSANIRLAQLTEPATAADLASAQQAIASATTQLASAQAALAKATAGPATTDVLAADSTVSNAQASLQSAKNAVETAKNTVTTATNNEASSKASLLGAQRAYCQTNVITVFACTESDLPLSDAMSHNLQSWIQNPTSGSPDQVSVAVKAATDFLSANTSYVNTKNAIASSQAAITIAQQSVETAQKSLDSAVAKKAALYDPPTATDLATLQAQVASAQAGIVSAQANLAKLVNGSATANDIALQQQSVKLAQISYQAAVDALQNLVLRAPFDGVIGAVPINVGDQVGASTSAATLSNPNAVRVDLTVSETDLPKYVQGQLGVASFDALPGKTYIVKVTAISNSPTVTQGVTTFAVQAQILNAADFASAANADALQQLASSLPALSGGGTNRTAGGTAAPGAAAAGTAGAVGAKATASGSAASGNTASGSTTASYDFAALATQPMPTPGMNANVTILTDVKTDQLLLPTNAIRKQGRQAFVYVQSADGKPVQQNITVGGADGTNTAITSGLNEGDKVLVGTVVVAATSKATTTTAAVSAAQATPAGGVR